MNTSKKSKLHTRLLENNEEGENIRINYIKAKIDYSMKNSKCRLCGDIVKTINHIKTKTANWYNKEVNSIYNEVGRQKLVQ